jgi:hypothetical protein
MHATRFNPLCRVVRKLGDAAGDAPCLIENQRLGDLSIAPIGVAIEMGEALTIRVHDLEAAV